ncbi:hypothetical protein STEG23_001503, partial [Scotinomys teguina]
MTVTSLGRDQDCSLKIRELDVPASWFLDPGGWSKTAVVSLYFIFPGICTLSLLHTDILNGCNNFVLASAMIYSFMRNHVLIDLNTCAVGILFIKSPPVQ